MTLFAWPDAQTVKGQPLAQRPIDVICLGRAGVDLYAREDHASFTEVSGFEKFVGGSPANIAAALRKLDVAAGFIGAVSDDGLGRYVSDYLNSIGVDTRGLETIDNGVRTSLAVTEMSADSPEVVIYRNNAADLGLHPRDISAEYIAESKILLISGTALCASPSREATLLAMQYARDHGTLIALDMDYRAYSWESPEAAAVYYHLATRLSDVVIGNQEEFAVLESMGINTSDDASIAEHYLQEPTRLLIIKKGHEGSHVYYPGGDFEKGIFPVIAQKPFGAGDAFAGSLLYGILNNLSLQDSVMLGSAAAAINVSRRTCSEAMPTKAELESFLQSHNQHFPTPISGDENAG